MSEPACVVCGKPIPASVLAFAKAAGVAAKYHDAKCRKKAKNLRYSRNVTKRRPIPTAV